jgi:hypothetical protein
VSLRGAQFNAGPAGGGDGEVFLMLKEFQPALSRGGDMVMEVAGETAMRASLAKGMPHGYSVSPVANETSAPCPCSDAGLLRELGQTIYSILVSASSCSDHSTGNFLRSHSRSRLAGCFPSNMASTILGASKVRRRTRPR